MSVTNPLAANISSVKSRHISLMTDIDVLLHSVSHGMLQECTAGLFCCPRIAAFLADGMLVESRVIGWHYCGG